MAAERDPAAGAKPASNGVVLIVDDEPVNRQLLEGMLRGRGMTVVQAGNGREAVELFAEQPPDLVLMDVLMPEMDGYEATRRIKAAQGDWFTPVLFVTALSDEQQLAQCVECGGDDFVSKPVNRVQLNAKIDSWLRIKDLYRTVRTQRDELDAYQTRNEVDQRLARDIMEKALRSDLLRQQSGIDYCYQPADILSGDMLLAARAPSGRADILVGDFTGHGVAAAMGSVPVSDLFHRMVRDGRDPGEIIDAINQRLYVYLPANLFLAAALVSVSPDGRTVSVWNGGMPDLLWLRDGELVERLPSTHLPLGIEERIRSHDRLCCYCNLEPGDLLLLYSDGVTEARNPQGEPFGESRLREAVRATGGDATQLGQRLDEFRGQRQRVDDLTILALRPDQLMETALLERSQSAPAMWTLSMLFDAEAMRQASPIPALVQLIVDIEKLAAEDGRRILTIITELFTNALEHGMLAMNSSLKRDASGFDDYYDLRRHRLETLRDGSLQLEVALRKHATTGRQLVIRVRDSGPGFDHDRLVPTLHRPAAENEFSGRGLRLVRGLCSDLRFHGRGNAVEAIYGIDAGPQRH